MQGIDVIFTIAILIMSVVIHEVSHGYVAYMLGDPTAKYSGRLTLNPFHHLDLFGSFIVPLLMYFGGGFILGWAKPVPYNPYNLKNQKWGPAMVGVAGPVSNLVVAGTFGTIIRFSPQLPFVTIPFIQIAGTIVFINIILAIFNLVPIPPLDGSKIFFAALPYKYNRVQDFLERNGLIVLLFFIFFLFQYLSPVIGVLFQVFTGVGI